MRPRSRRVLWLLAALLVVALHLPAMHGAFLSDDWSVLHALAEAEAADGSVWPWALSTLWSPLSAFSHYYRPLGILSFAADYVAAGIDPFPWHVTNLALHLANGALLALVLRALPALRGSWAPGVAAVLFWCSPAAPEVSLWISGRYDALAGAGMLLAVAAHLRANGHDRWRAVSLAGFAFALGAKEAAMLLPGFLLLASALRNSWRAEAMAMRLRRVLRECWPALLLFAFYLLWRTWLFGTPLRVYVDTPPLASLLWEWPQRVMALVAIVPAAAQPLPRALWWLLGGAWCALLLAGAWRGSEPQRRAQLLCAACCALSLAALLPHLSGTSGTGEGGRLLYVAGAWLAGWSAIALLALGRGPLPAIAALLLVGACATAQALQLRHWSAAGATMQHVLAAIDAWLPQSAPGRYALLLLPDHLGAVPFARNAQGALVGPPRLGQSRLDRVAPLLPTQFEEWSGHVAAALPQRLMGVAAGTAVPLQALCYDPTTQALHPLQVPAPHGAEWRAWQSAWREAVAESPCAPMLEAF